jgi:hypothetical protein
VARVARAGSSRRSGQRRHLGFPITIGLIVALGIVLVVYSRDSRNAVAHPLPGGEAVGGDHWHAAYGIYLCDHFVAPLVDGPQGDLLGIHTHGDGAIHIHPFAGGAAGTNAQLGLFFDDTGLEVSNSKIVVPGGETVEEGTDQCDGKDAIVEVAYWANADDAAAGEKPTTIFTDDFSSIRFRQDRSAYTIAFLPEGDEIPPPDTLSVLDNLSDVGNATSSTLPTDSTGTTGTGTTGTTTGDGTTTTGAGATTTSSTPPEETTTTPTSS